MKKKKTDLRFLYENYTLKWSKRLMGAVLAAALAMPAMPFCAIAATKPDNYGKVIYFENFEEDTQIDTDSLEYKSTLTIGIENGDTSVMGSEKQGNYAKVEQKNTDGDSYFRIRYEEKSGKAMPPVKSLYSKDNLDELAKMQVSFDICSVGSKDKRINICFYDKLSHPELQTKSQTLMSLGTDGMLAFSNTDIKVPYQEKKWMSFDFYLNFESHTYSAYLDNQLVVDNVELGALDFCVEAFGIQAGELTADKSYVIYMDNLRIAVPQKAEIQLSEKNGRISVDAYAPMNKNAFLIATSCKDGAMEEISMEKLQKNEDRLAVQYSCEVADGIEYAFYLFEDNGGITPLSDKKVFYAGIEYDEITDILKSGVAVMNFALNAVANGEIKPLQKEDRVITADGASVASLLFFEKVLEAHTATNGDSITISLSDKTININPDSNEYCMDGQTGVLNTSVATREGIVYIPLAEVVSLLGKTAVSFDSVIVIDNSEAAEEIKQSPSIKEKLASALHSVKLFKVTDEDWKKLKDNWRKYLTGDENKNLADWQLQEALELIDAECESAWNSIDKNNEAFALFGTTSCTTTADMTKQYAKLYAMAKAYGTYGSEYYGNELLKEDILFALEWLYENLYGQSEIDGAGWKSTSDYNWWDWFCATPQYLTDTLLIMENTLTDSQIGKYLSLYEHLRKTMRTQATPSSASSRVCAGVAASALLEDADAMKKFKDDYKLILLPVEKGDGVHEDGLYICHDYFAYTTEYGTASLLDRFSKIQAISNGTIFEIDFPCKYNSCEWMYETFAPVTFNGYMTSAQSGRAKDKDEEYFTGFFIAGMLDYIGNFGIDDDIKLKQLIKRNVTNENISEIKEMLNIEQLINLNEILNDETIDSTPYYNNKIYYSGDSVMHHRDNFGFALSMSSSRIAPWESINANNMTGWYQGDGMLYTYIDTDPKSYGKDYWQKVNPYHLPGTTVDTQQRLATSIKNSSELLTNQDFVGAAGFDDLYATAAMQLESYHNDNKDAVTSTEDHGGDAPYHECTLMAKKAWFMFDDEVVCLGSDINSSDGFEVHTVIENRMLSKTETVSGKKILGTEAITVDGKVLEKASNYKKTYENPDWVHIEGISGYYLPNGGQLVMDKVTNGRNFIEMRLSHGISPQKGSYAYVVLPKKTADETANYSENPDIEILVNTDKIQAVNEKTLGIRATVFWQAGSFENIAVSAPMIVMNQYEKEVCRVSISDPTQLLGIETVTIDGEYELSEADECLTAFAGNGKTIITVDFEQTKGRTLSAKLKAR